MKLKTTFLSLTLFTLITSSQAFSMFESIENDTQACPVKLVLNNMHAYGYLSGAMDPSVLSPGQQGQFIVMIEGLGTGAVTFNFNVENIWGKSLGIIQGGYSSKINFFAIPQNNPKFTFAIASDKSKFILKCA